MNPARITTIIRTADPSSDGFLTAVEWLCKRGQWALCDELLTERERTIDDERRWKQTHRHWAGPVKHDEAA